MCKPESQFTQETFALVWENPSRFEPVLFHFRRLFGLDTGYPGRLTLCVIIPCMDWLDLLVNALFCLAIVLGGELVLLVAMLFVMFTVGGGNLDFRLVVIVLGCGRYCYGLYQDRDDA